MKLLTDIPAEGLRGKRVLVRAGLDVPLVDGSVEAEGSFRIQASVPTLAYLKERGARIIVISHIGRDPSESLASAASALAARIPLTFVPSLLGDATHEAIGKMQDGDIIVLENLRQDPREAANDPAFAASLAALGELYVNDAFSVCHRAHASIAGIPKLLPGYAGLELADEVAHLTEALTPSSPSLAILAGAKFETKEPLIRKLLDTYDRVFVGGALANDIFKARGFPVGKSRVSDQSPSADVLANPKLIAPSDVTVRHADGTNAVVAPSAVEDGDMNMDMGPATFAALEPLIKEGACVLWNGPTGIYEEGFEEWSLAIARAIAGSGARSTVGGGDTVTAIADAHLFDKFSFVSTGGGAMLDFLTDGTLPGIEALA